MKPSLGLLAGGAVALGAMALFVVGVPGGRRVVPPGPAGVSAGGITLASTAIALPVDDGHFPAGRDVELVDAACTACHSAAMALSQPPLSATQWQAEVTKMREAYHAPVAEADVAAIVAYLAAMPGQAAPAGR